MRLPNKQEIFLFRVYQKTLMILKHIRMLDMQHKKEIIIVEASKLLTKPNI